MNKNNNNGNNNKHKENKMKYKQVVKTQHLANRVRLPLKKFTINSERRRFFSIKFTGRNHMFPYFWNVAETCNSMFPLCLRLTETWKLKSTCFRHVNGTEMPSHVSVIFKPAHFRRCSFPSCFCKRICSFLLHLTKTQTRDGSLNNKES